ncbi:MAG: hypothetical protein GTN39_00590 [Candidatus Aenigmarchaeota archaeon]|nr:hypothetical protein [Candidatus Aenigmarchaeota archaeon]
MKGLAVNLITATILFLFSLGGISAVQNLYYTDFAGIMKIPIENLEVVESAHAVESCLARLSANERFISKDILEEHVWDSVNRMCEIQEPIMWGYVNDMEDGKEYSFPPPKSDDMVKKLFPPAMVTDDFLKKIREWNNKDIKTEHMIWVSIVVPEVKKITDENFELTGEFLIQAKWEGLGSPVKNDLILRLYPKDYYKTLPANIQTISYHEIVQWLGDMEKNGVKFDSRIANFYHIPVRDIIPNSLVECGKMNILDSVKSETCVEIFERISEIRMGRLGVKI